MINLRPALGFAPEDLECLKPGGLVTGIIVNSFFRLIERRSIFYETLPNVWACDSCLISDWPKGGYEATRRRVKQVDVFSRDLLLFPINVPTTGPNGHWALIVARPKKAEIEAYDPLGLQREKEMDTVLAFLKEAAHAQGRPLSMESWTKTETPPGCPRQRDEISCGVFTCAYGDKIARNSDLKGQRILPGRARMTIASVLRKGKFDYENFPLMEPPDWRRDERFAGPAQPYSPTILIDLCTPDNRKERREQQYDPLIDQLNVAIDALEVKKSPDLFPPLLKTVDKEKKPEEEKKPDEEKSPCLSMEASDLEEETEETLNVPPGAVEKPALTMQDRESDLLYQLPSTTERHFPSSTTSSSRRKRRNQKWRVIREDGTWVRIRAHKLKRLNTEN